MSRRLKIALSITGSILLAGAAFVFFWVRSHSTDDHLKLVPKDAAVVLRIDIQQLAQKADPAKLLQEPAFRKSGKSLTSLMSDPFSSGIDPLENIYGFLTKMDTGVALALVFNVDDAEKLAQFTKKASLGIPVETDGHYQVASNTGFCIAWNDEAGILLYTSGANAPHAAAKFLAQEKSRSITESKEYHAFVEKKNDIGLFINNKQLSLVGGSQGSLSPLGITDGYGEIAMNFESDKITVVYSNNPGKAVSVPVIRTGGQHEKQYEAVAPETPVAYAGLAADMNMLLTVLNNEPTMQDNLAMAEMAMGLTDGNLKNLFTGDIQIAFTGYKDIATIDPRIQAEVRKAKATDKEATDADFTLFVPMTYISLGETDDEKINNIFYGLGMVKMNNAWVVPGIDFIVYASAKNGHLLITNDYYAADSMAVTGKLNGKLPADLPKKEPLTAYVNLSPDQLPASIVQPDPASELSAIFPDALPWLKPFTHADLRGEINHTELTLHLAPGEGNSLYRLLSAYASLLN